MINWKWSRWYLNDNGIGMQGLISIFQIADSGEQEGAGNHEWVRCVVEPSWGLLTEWSSLEHGQRTHPAHWPLVLPPAGPLPMIRKQSGFTPSVSLQLIPDCHCEWRNVGGPSECGLWLFNHTKGLSNLETLLIVVCGASLPNIRKLLSTSERV